MQEGLLNGAEASGALPLALPLRYGKMLSAALKHAVEEKKCALQRDVLTWAASYLRDYPWRRPGQNLYMILVAEILLKRTTATAAARVYEVFLEKYPTLFKLATATQAELAHDLAPIGLYRQRASAIAQLTSYLIEHEGGLVPKSLERLLRTPGLGHYSARAILSFGHDVPTAVVDANVRRVLLRVLWGVIPSKSTQASLQAIADMFLPEHAHRSFNFAMLDLGALICRYTAPQCQTCPLDSVCDSYKNKAAEQQVLPISLLRQVRLASGVTLAQLAKRAGVSKLTIINIEAQRTTPRQETIQKLAVALEVAPADIL